MSKERGEKNICEEKELTNYKIYHSNYYIVLVLI